MSKMDTIMDNIGIPKLKEYFGDPATITSQSSGLEFTIVGIRSENFNYTGEVIDLPENMMRVEFKKQEYSNPIRDDRVLFRGIEYRVDRIDPDKTDEYFICVWLIPL